MSENSPAQDRPAQDSLQENNDTLPAPEGAKSPFIEPNAVQNINADAAQNNNDHKQNSDTGSTPDKAEAHDSVADKPGANCATCGKYYAKKDSLRFHVKSQHEEHKFKCPDCPKTFPFNHAYVTHLRQHSDERPFPCPLDDCDATFSSQKGLNQHAEKHSGIEYKCEICGKVFGAKNDPDNTQARSSR